VDTTKRKEAITAISPTSSGVIFDQWRILLPPGPDTGRVLTVGKGVSVIALAFYKAPPPPPPGQQACSQAVESLQQIIQDGGPPLLPAELKVLTDTLERCVREHYLTQAFVNSLLAEYAATIRERSNPPPRPGT
jgi:hypothetical protein